MALCMALQVGRSLLVFLHVHIVTSTCKVTALGWRQMAVGSYGLCVVLMGTSLMRFAFTGPCGVSHCKHLGHEVRCTTYSHMGTHQSRTDIYSRLDLEDKIVHTIICREVLHV